MVIFFSLNLKSKSTVKLLSFAALPSLSESAKSIHAPLADDCGSISKHLLPSRLTTFDVPLFLDVQPPSEPSAYPSKLSKYSVPAAGFSLSAKTTAFIDEKIIISNTITTDIVLFIFITSFPFISI